MTFIRPNRKYVVIIPYIVEKITSNNIPNINDHQVDEKNDNMESNFNSIENILLKFSYMENKNVKNNNIFNDTIEPIIISLLEIS